MKSDSLLVAVCMKAMYFNKKELVEGLNSLEGVGVSFNIGITKKNSIEELVKVDMKKTTCSEDTIIILCISLFAIIIIIGSIIGLWYYVRRKRGKTDVHVSIDVNPDYHSTYYDDGGCEVKDNTDYYFDGEPEDIAEVIDTNEYYD